MVNSSRLRHKHFWKDVCKLCSTPSLPCSVCSTAKYDITVPDTSERSSRFPTGWGCHSSQGVQCHHTGIALNPPTGIHLSDKNSTSFACYCFRGLFWLWFGFGGKKSTQRRQGIRLLAGELQLYSILILHHTAHLLPAAGLQRSLLQIVGTTIILWKHPVLKCNSLL